MPFANCCICRADLGSPRSASQHMRRHHSDMMWVTTECRVCGVSFTRYWSILRQACSPRCAGLLTIGLASHAITCETRSRVGKLRAARLWDDPVRKAVEMARRKTSGHYLAVAAKMKAGGAAKAKLASSRGRPSKPQLEMFELLRQVYPAAQLEFAVGSRLVDVAVPALQLAFEYDGAYWHSFKDDTARDAELGKLGWTTQRFSSLEEVRSALRGI